MEAEVREFHKKMGYPCDIPLENLYEGSLYNLGVDLRRMAERFESTDPRKYRVHLLLEELSELVEALHEGAEISLADAIGDLLYVTVGTAVTFGIPVREVFDEIHESNMTKERTDFRLRNKGENYKSPDIEKALHLGRNRRAFEKRIQDDR